MLTASSMTDVAAMLKNGIESGQGSARASLGAGISFAEIDGSIRTLANYARHISAGGMSVPVTIASESGTPAAEVAESATKPDALQLEQSSKQLLKFAAIGSLSLEASLSADAVESAVAGLLNGSVLKAVEGHLTGVVAAGAGGNVPAPPSWVEGLAEAQGLITAAGGTAGVVSVSASDWGSFAADVLGTQAFAMSPESPVGAVLGVPVHISPNQTPGQALVYDTSALCIASHEQSPFLILDGVSRAEVNQLRVVVEVVAAGFVVSAAKAVTVAAPAPA